MKEQHLLVDYENVQPSMEELLKIAPKLTDVWLFHGPNQTKRAEQLKAANERVTLVPHTGKGKNALDFHLSFYLGYVAAKHPDATLVVVANDKGYDSMLGHAKLLGFTATRTGFKVKKAPTAKKVPSARKVTPTIPPALVSVPVKKTPVQKALVKKAVAEEQPKAQAPAKKVPAAKKVLVKQVPTKKTAKKKAPAKKSVAKVSGAVQAAPKAVPNPADKVLVRAKAALSKMGKNRPTKLAPLLRHLKSMVGQGATTEDADALSRRLEEVKAIQVVGDLVLYP